MFTHILSQHDRKVLVHAFAYLAHVDQELHQEELDRIVVVARNLGLDPQIIIDDVGSIDLDAMLREVESEQAKRVILQELLNLAYADGNYSEEEREGIVHIAQTFGVKLSILDKIEDWVAKGRAWVQEGDRLFLMTATAP
jgi:uncharacterized tellurite resistance protein B-like protein